MKLFATKELNQLDITLIIFLGIILLLALFFSILFWLQYKYIQKTRKLKIECNKLKSSTPIDQFKYLESLSKNNKQLENIAISIAQARKFYIEQTKKMKSNIMVLNILSHNFFFIRSSKMIKIIEKDIVHCNTLCNLIKEVFKSATDYNESSASVVSGFREAFSSILHFYRTNLQAQYDKPEILHMVEAISREITQADNNMVAIDNEKLIQTIYLVSENEKNLLKTIRTIYVYRYTYYYFQRCKTELDASYKNRSNILNQKEKNEIQKSQIDLTYQLTQLKNNLSALKFDASNKLIHVIANKLEPNINLFKENENINIMLEGGMKFIIEQSTILSENYFELNKALQALCVFFKTDNQSLIQEKIDNLTHFYKKINTHVDELKRQQRDSNYVDRISFIKEICQTIKDLQTWMNKLQELYNYSVATYRSSIEIVDNIFDAEWAIVQMLNIKKTITPDDAQSFNIINDAIMKINEAKTLIKTNYAANYSNVLQIISDVKKIIEKLYNSYFLDKSIQVYARNLIFFANKYRYENDAIAKSINKSEELYKQHKYTDAIDALLPTLTYVKESAKQSHVKFN